MGKLFAAIVALIKASISSPPTVEFKWVEPREEEEVVDKERVVEDVEETEAIFSPSC